MLQFCVLEKKNCHSSNRETIFEDLLL